MKVLQDARRQTGAPAAGNALGTLVSSSGTPLSAGLSWRPTEDHLRPVPDDSDGKSRQKALDCRSAARDAEPTTIGTDERGIVTKANLIVGTTNNYAPSRCRFKRRQGFIHKGTVVTDGRTQRVEMAFRAYDPCFGWRDPFAAGPDAAASDCARCPGRRCPSVETVFC